MRVKVTQENSNLDTYWFDAARMGQLVVRQIWLGKSFLRSRDDEATG